MYAGDGGVGGGQQSYTAPHFCGSHKGAPSNEIKPPHDMINSLLKLYFTPIGLQLTIISISSIG